MWIQQSKRIAAIFSFGLLLAAGAGCSDRGYGKYIPSEDKARQALEAALNAWKDGKRPGAIDGAAAPVHAVDSQWQRGVKIADYEILNEENSEGPRVFSVRLTLQRPANKQVVVRYLVVGKEPLWVYREDDYKAPAGMQGVKETAMRRASPMFLWLAAGCAVAAAGCGDAPSPARYVPRAETAREALETALRSWQKGRPSGRLEGTTPEVVLVDNCRRDGQTLKSFAILGETPGEGPRCLAVRLRLENPEEEQRVRFVVFGVDPLWVYRYEDYEMMIHWQCGQDEREGKASPSPN